MNAEKLHAIALVLRREMSSTNIVAKLEALRASMEQVSTQNHPQYQENLANNLKGLFASFGNNPSDSFSPAWRQLLSEMGGVGLFGAVLKQTIEQIVQTNQMTPAVAAKDLAVLKERLESFQKSLERMTEAFKQFRIGNEQLEPGECEIGMLIPRAEVDNELKEFTKELEELTFILNTFSEVATGKTDKLLIKTLSSSDLTVYLQAGVPFAACLAVSIERIIALYQRLLEIRKLRAELLKQGVPDKQAAGVEEYANNIMNQGIEELSVEIVNRFYQANEHGKDGGRKNELTTQTRISLNRLANRIDRGYNIEVRVEPIKEAAPDTDAAKRTVADILAIQAASKNMQFMKLQGAPILQLPESVEKPKSKKNEPPPSKP